MAILIGFLISFSGSLPLGNLNLTAMQIAAYGHFRKALWFSLGVVLVEVFYLSFSFIAIQWVVGNKHVFAVLQWAAVLLLLLMATSAFHAAKKNRVRKNVILDNKLPRFVLGCFMSAVNPMQIPFWAGWITYALSNHWIANSQLDAVLFITGAGAGTYIALLAFIIAGNKLSGWLIRNYVQIQLSMGGIFLLLAVFQALKLTGIL